MRTYLDFEKPIAELESKVAELRDMSRGEGSLSLLDEITTLEAKTQEALEDTYANLSPWQKTQVARHPDRPHCQDYIDALIDDFTPLSGDRYFAEDHAIVGGLGRFDGQTIMLIGHEKGSDTETRLKHNFGMARPEGYRKAIRLMQMAETFGLPVLTLVDTAGAYPGVGAEERGQAEAIARSIQCCLSLSVPIVAVVIGEGGSGGAVAIATGKTKAAAPFLEMTWAKADANSTSASSIPRLPSPRARQESSRAAARAVAAPDWASAAPIPSAAATATRTRSGIASKAWFALTQPARIMSRAAHRQITTGGHAVNATPATKSPVTATARHMRSCRGWAKLDTRETRQKSLELR